MTNDVNVEEAIYEADCPPGDVAWCRAVRAQYQGQAYEVTVWMGGVFHATVAGLASKHGIEWGKGEQVSRYYRDEVKRLILEGRLRPGTSRLVITGGDPAVDAATADAIIAGDARALLGLGPDQTTLDEAINDLAGR